MKTKANLFLEDAVEGVRIKGLKFYTMNDGTGAMKHLAQIALDKELEGLSII